jgi:hypothetical protein
MEYQKIDNLLLELIISHRKIEQSYLKDKKSLKQYTIEVSRLVTNIRDEIMEVK